MFETLQEKTEEKAMVQFLERFTDYPFLESSRIPSITSERVNLHLR